MESTEIIYAVYAALYILFVAVFAIVFFFFRRYLMKKSLNENFSILLFLPFIYYSYSFIALVFFPYKDYQKEMLRVFNVEYPESTLYLERDTWAWGAYGNDWYSFAYVKTDADFVKKIKEKAVSQKYSVCNKSLKSCLNPFDLNTKESVFFEKANVEIKEICLHLPSPKRQVALILLENPEEMILITKKSRQ